MNPKARASTTDLPSPSGGSGDLRWAVLGLAFLATVINYLDRQTLSVLAPVLLERFAISATAYSWIVFAFLLAYTVMNGVSGPLLDRLGSRVGYPLTVAFWSAAELLTATVTGAWTLGASRFLLGMGEAGNFPAGVKVIGEWFSPAQRSLASGIFNSGAAVGAMLAPPLLAWSTLQFGWRASFAVVGALGFLWVIAWLAIYRAPETPGEIKPVPVPVRALLGDRFVRQFTLSKVFSDPVWYFYTFWFPQYLKVGHGFTLAQIGAVGWIPFATAGLGNLAGGVLTMLLARRGVDHQTARRISVVVFSVCMTAAFPAAMVDSAALSIALISTATFGYTGALANTLALPRDVYPKNAVASIWGLASMGSGFGGMIFSLATGWLVDHVSFTPVFMLFGTLPLIAAALVWTLPRTARATALEPVTP